MNPNKITLVYWSGQIRILQFTTFEHCTHLGGTSVWSGDADYALPFARCQCMTIGCEKPPTKYYLETHHPAR